MPWSWGGAAKGASGGLRALIDVLQYNDQEKRRGEATAYERTRDAEGDKRRVRDEQFRAIGLLDQLSGSGGYVEEPGVQGAPMFQQRLGPVGQPTERPVALSDILGDEGQVNRIRIDPMRSPQAKLQREKQADELTQRNATAGLFTDPAEQGAVRSGVPVSDVRGARPPVPPVIPERNIDPLSPEGITASVNRERQIAAIPPRSQSGTPASRAPRPPTEGQRKAKAFLMMAESAVKDLDALAASGKTVPTLKEKIGSQLGRNTGNYLTTSEYRQMEAAALRLSDSWLRYTSGAAVPELEVQRFAKGFLPVPGDDPATLAKKQQSRRLVIDALREASGEQISEVQNAFEDLVPPSRGGRGGR